MRRGITLLEVLISMFIMTVGLLSVASLIPVGKTEQSKGARIDRTAAAGRAALRDIKTRGLLSPSSWAIGHTTEGTPNAVYDPAVGFRFGASQYNPAAPESLTSPTGAYGGIVPFVIDPLGSSSNLGPWFPQPPATATYPAAPQTPPAPPSAPYMPRLTLGPTSTAVPVTRAMRSAMSDLVFRCSDDLIFEQPSGGDAVPIQTMQGTARRLSNGDYSWLATVVPDAQQASSMNALDINYTVSVAVFHKRPFNPLASGERTCGIALPPGSPAQDECILTLQTADIAPQYGADGKAHLNVKAGQWLMLAGWILLDHDNNAATPMVERWQFAWHRIVNVDDVEVSGTAWTRNVSLNGPFTDLNAVVPPAANVTAFLFDGIQNVYEQTMRLESN